MAISIPRMLRDFWDDPWISVTTPSRLFDQSFGDVLKDVDLTSWDGCGDRSSRSLRRPPQSTGMSEVVNTDKEFRVGLDVRHFKPEELKLTTRDNRVVISGRHEERPDEHGFIMRGFQRQYVLPKDVDPNAVTSALNRDGMLFITAPKKALEPPKERAIPITHEPDKKGH